MDFVPCHNSGCSYHMLAEGYSLLSIQYKGGWSYNYVPVNKDCVAVKEVILYTVCLRWMC